MDTASTLEESVHYMKYLKKQVQSLEQGAVVGGMAMVPINKEVNVSGDGERERERDTSVEGDEERRERVVKVLVWVGGRREKKR
ncbi:hypothetical protein Tco_0266990 [Tanacetum coccineum]